MSRILFIVLLALLPLLANADVQAPDAVKINGYWFDLFDSYGTGTCRFTAEFGGSGGNSYSLYSGDIVIPSNVTHNSKTYTVTTLGANAFYRSSGITSLYIPSTITIIEDLTGNVLSSMKGVICNIANANNIKAGISHPGVIISTSNDNLYRLGTYPDDCVLVVPAGSKSSYTTNGWGTVFKGGIYEGIVIIADNKSMTYGDNVPQFTWTYFKVKDDPIYGSPEFTCSASSQSNVGTYSIVVTSKNLQTSDITNFKHGVLTINKAPLTVSAINKTITYGDPLPSFGVQYSGFKNNENASVLTTASSASCTATSSSAPGTYPITVSGGSATNYSFNYVNGTLTITPKNASNFTINDITAVTYNGSAQTPAITVKDGSTTLTSGTDYSVTYSNNINAGTATVTVTGMGNYTGTKTANFTINPKTVNNPTITLSMTSFTFDGNAKQPTVTVKDGSTVIPTSEYTVSYSNNTNVGTATVTITDKTGGNYTVSGSTTFSISAATLTGVTATSYNGTYDGAAHTISVTVPSGATIKYGTTSGTYNLTSAPTYTDVCNNTIYYKVSKTNYTDVTGSATVKITAKTVSNTTITLSQTNYTYDGNAKQPTVTVKNGSTTLTSGDYTVSYSNNINAGTATVTVTGMGNYTGTKTANFTINKASLTITANSYTINQGDPLPTFGCTYSGFVNGENETVLTTQPTFSCIATSTSSPGSYDINVSGAAAQNYQMNYVKGTVTVEIPNSDNETDSEGFRYINDFSYVKDISDYVANSNYSYFTNCSQHITDASILKANVFCVENFYGLSEGQSYAQFWMYADKDLTKGSSQFNFCWAFYSIAVDDNHFSFREAYDNMAIGATTTYTHTDGTVYIFTLLDKIVSDINSEKKLVFSVDRPVYFGGSNNGSIGIERFSNRVQIKYVKDSSHDIIDFADANVKALCVANWDTNSDGELDEGEAASVTDLGEVFKNKTNITSFNELQYFTGLTAIGDMAFYCCTSLTSVIIPNGVTSIGEDAFNKCSLLSSITLPNTMKSIGSGAFYSCIGLTSVTIPNGVTSIDHSAFFWCSSLTTMNIPSSVTSIGGYAFSATGWADNQSNGILYLDNWLLGYKGDKPQGELTITEGTKGIAGQALSNCSGLTSVTIPNTLISIGYQAFEDCSGLTSITIPNSVNSIGFCSFSGCI